MARVHCPRGNKKLKAIFEDAMWRRVYREDSWRENNRKCHYCRNKLELKEVTADHVVPQSKYGLTKRENIKGCCFSCNQNKRSLSEKEYMSRLRKLPPNANIWLKLRHIDYRLNIRIEKAEKRILSLVGLEV
jgi:hypothetical protein